MTTIDITPPDKKGKKDWKGEWFDLSNVDLAYIAGRSLLI